MKTHLLKIILCLFVILLTSCEKDLYEDVIHQQHEHRDDIDVKTLSLEEFTEKLKQEMEDANCTGIEFQPVELSVDEWLQGG